MAHVSLGRAVSLLCTALVLAAMPAFGGVAFAEGASTTVPRRGSLPSPEPPGGSGAGQPTRSATDPANPASPSPGAPTPAQSTGAGVDPPGTTQPRDPPSNPTAPAPTVPAPRPSPSTADPSESPTAAPAPATSSPGPGNGVPAPIPSAATPTTSPNGPLRGGGDAIPGPQHGPNAGSTPSVNAAPAPTLPPNALLDLLSRPGLGTQLVMAGAVGLFISVVGLAAVGWRRRRG